ncbi:MAG: hypothetical protein WD845_09800 [Pirellulales bacterium]
MSKPVGAAVVVAWIAVVVYLAAFFWTALPIVVPDSNVVIRRLDVLLTIFLGEQTVAYWFEGFSGNSLWQRGHILTAVAAIFLVACAAGWICLRVFGVDRQLTRLEQFVFAAGTGLNLVSLATLALGMGGVMNRWGFAALGAAIVASAVVMARRDKNPPAKPGADRLCPPASSLQPPACSRQPPAVLCSNPHWLWAGLPFVVVLVLGAMLPPVDFDVREYHLQAPKEFYQNGRVEFLPHNIYANMPLGTEMLSLAGMIVCGDWWLGALVGKTLIALFAPLAALALVAAGKRFVSPAAGIVAALVYISVPWIALVSTQGLVEGAFAYYLFAALLAVMLWQASDDMRRERLLWLAGFLAGAAVSTKYPAVLFSVLPLAATIGYTALRAPRDKHAPRNFWRQVVRPVAAFLLFVALGCGLWLAKNAATTGNPVYPLMAEVFDGRTRTAEKNAQWTAAHDPPNWRIGDLAQRAAGIALTSPWLSPLLAPLAMLSFFGRRRRMACWLAAYFAFVFLGWWLFTHRIDRFWVPVLPVAALLAGMGATWTDARTWRVPCAVLLVCGLVSNFVLITSGTLGDHRYFADLNVLRVDPARVDPWHQYLNEHADEVTGVLMVGDAEPFDLEVPVRYNTVFDDNLFEAIARGRTPQQVRETLTQQKITHVYVSWSEIARYRSPGNYGFTKFVDPSVFAALEQAGVLAALPAIDGNPNALYRVVPASPNRADSGESR